MNFKIQHIDGKLNIYTNYCFLSIMVCPFCGSQNLRVIDKRSSSAQTIRRRRECENCKKRFTTYERIEKVTMQVIKRDGRVEEFDREKIKRGILKAVKKRDISDQILEDIVHEIEQQLLNSGKQFVRSVDIGEMVLTHLTQVDKLGALLFAAVYKEFKSLEDVEKELNRLSKKNIN